MIDAEYMDTVRIISMYFMALFLVGYCSTLFASFAYIAADYAVTVSHETAPYIAGAFNALCVAFCIALMAWLGEFLATGATYSMLIMPFLYLAVYNWRNIQRRWRHARASRMVLEKYRIPYNVQLERGHAAGDFFGFLIGAAFFMPGAPAV